jgi:hypothetical protein
LFLLAFGCVGVAWTAVLRLRKWRSTPKPAPKRSARDELDEELGEAIADIEAFRKRFQVVPEAARSGSALPRPVVLKGAVPAPPRPPVVPPAPVAAKDEAPIIPVVEASTSREATVEDEKPDMDMDDELMALFEEAATFQAAPAPIRESVEEVSAAELLAEARQVRALLQPRRGRAA